MPRIAFVGLGNMGGRMARRLATAGHSVSGLDPRAGLAEELGLEPLATVAEACEREFVFLSLPSSREVEEVFEGPGGILESGREGLVVVDMTTAEAASTRRLNQEAVEHGIALLDAPISGGPAPAEAGTLTIMVGGDAEALELVRPMLEELGSTIHHLGGSGSGHVAKAVNNFLNGINLAATAEAMVLGVKSGLDARQLVDVINGSSGRNFATEVRFQRILEGDYQEGALKTGLMAKDIEVYLGLAREEAAPTYLAAPLLDVYQRLIAGGYADQPANRLVDVLGDEAGGVRMQRPPVD